MKILLPILAMMLALWSCTAQGTLDEKEDFYKSRNPATPSLDSLQALPGLPADSLVRNLERHPDGIDQYFYQDDLYTGWARQIYPDNSHRYRFTRYESGQLVWQIGYFENGVLDHDFRMKNGQSLGCERMWKEDGKPYVYNFFSAPGVFDGVQKRWYTNGQLAVESDYNNGLLVYKIEWDKEGKVILTEGSVPDVLVK